MSGGAAPSFGFMKSAYELAMERLEKEDPSSGSLSSEQKERLDEINQRFRAKIAEREVFLQGKIAVAQASGQLNEVEELERELRDEKRMLEEECEGKKEQVRRESL